VKKHPNILVIACNIMKNELMAVNGTSGAHFEFLEQSLHRTPVKMPAAVQEKINQAGKDIDYVVLGYGTCGNGIIGVKAGKQPLVIPKAPDCITFFLGSLEAHLKEHKKAPGTYYLNKGWIDEAKDPLGVLEEYTQKYGRQTAEWVIREEFKNYKRIVLVTTPLFDPATYRARAKADADFLGLAYEGVEGSLGFFEKMVKGNWNSDEFIIIPPGQEITQKTFNELINSYTLAHK